MLDAEVDRENARLRINALHELEPLGADENELIRAEVADLAGWLGVGLPDDW
jgi:hypothetical protein